MTEEIVLSSDGGEAISLGYYFLIFTLIGIVGLVSLKKRYIN